MQINMPSVICITVEYAKQYILIYMKKTLLLKSLAITTVISLFSFAFFFLQLPADRRMSLFFFNKAVADTSVVLIGLSFLLGPLCKIIPRLGSHLYLRRYFGVTGFFIAVLHLIVSLMQYSDRFPLSWYFSHWIGVLAAIIATVIFTVLAVTSNTKAIVKLGGSRWKNVQRVGYFATFLVMIHIFVAASPRWQMWTRGEANLPSSLVVFIFAAIVLLARLIALIIDSRHHE